MKRFAFFGLKTQEGVVQEQQDKHPGCVGRCKCCFSLSCANSSRCNFNWPCDELLVSVWVLLRKQFNIHLRHNVRHNGLCLSALKVLRLQNSPLYISVTAALTWHRIDIQDGCRGLGEQEVGGWGWRLTVQKTTAGWQSQMSKQRLRDSAIYYGISRHCCYCCRQRMEVCVCVCGTCWCVCVSGGGKENHLSQQKTLKSIIEHPPLWWAPQTLQCVHTPWHTHTHAHTHTWQREETHRRSWASWLNVMLQERRSEPRASERLQSNTALSFHQHTEHTLPRQVCVCVCVCVGGTVHFCTCKASSVSSIEPRVCGYICAWIHGVTFFEWMHL